MDILFITPYLPSENSGHAGTQLIFRKLKQISKIHEIKVVSFFNSEDKNHFTEIEKLGIDVISVPYERNRYNIIGNIISIYQNLVPLLNSIMGRDIYFISKYNRSNMQRKLIEIKTSFKPDLIQFEYNVMHHYANLFPNIPKILVQHDISTKVYERGAEKSQTKSGRRKNQQLFRIANRSESEWMNKFDHVITLTEEDKQYCRSKWNNLPNITVIPPSIAIQKHLDIKKNKHELCFVGSFNREPNVQAVEILLEDILPVVNKHYPDVTLKIAGKYLPQILIDKINRNDNVIYAGFVKNIDTFIGESSLFVAPIKIGAGLKMKITHALACGTAVLTTPIGSEGIPLRDADGLFIEQDVANIIEKCILLIQTPDNLAEVGQLGKIKVQKLFSREIIGKKYNDLYEKILAQ